MKRLLTMSNSALLSKCTYPFAEDVTWEREESSEAASYGSAFHEVIASVKPNAVAVAAKKWGVNASELKEHTDEAGKCLDAWVRGGNEWRLDLGRRVPLIEASLAYDCNRNTTRFCDAPTEDGHEYLDRRKGEIVGTGDLIFLPTKKINTLIALDHKTGFNADAPDKSDQLLTIACACCDLPDVPEPDRVILAIHHAPRRGIPTVYATEVSADRLEEHRQLLRKQLQRIGDGSMTPGKHCTSLYCPARFTCPTRDADLLKAASNLLPQINEAADLAFVANGNNSLSKAEQLGKIHQLCETYDALRARLRELIKEGLTEIGHGVRPDGRLVELQTKSVERLSKASVERALGRLAGGRELARLRKLGCLETRDQVEIHKVIDR
jgi:Protein of unknown function (DUF2800)